MVQSGETPGNGHARLAVAVAGPPQNRGAGAGKAKQPLCLAPKKLPYIHTKSCAAASDATMPAWRTLLPLAVLCCCSWHLSAPAAARQQDTHNPLERINVGAASVQGDNQIKLAVSTTKLTKREGELVEVRRPWVGLTEPCTAVSAAPHSLPYTRMQVSWHGVQHPSYADWIGLLVRTWPAAPAKFQMASADLDATHLKTGAGRLRFRVINHRTAVQFAFLRGGLMQPVLAARSPPIQPSNPNEPLQRRLALTGDNRCACCKPLVGLGL